MNDLAEDNAALRAQVRDRKRRHFLQGRANDAAKREATLEAENEALRAELGDVEDVDQSDSEANTETVYTQWTDDIDSTEE